ncbi:hypothetical protein MXD81_08820, partial [Microbacteriaceae bacterium K1510]|nr:hypothetical protein [Microbacteriaceae bacterium K1510]
MKRLVTGMILTSVFTLAIPLAGSGMALAAGKTPAAPTAPVKPVVIKVPAATAGKPAAGKAPAAKPAAAKPAAAPAKAPVIRPVQLLDGANENPRWINAEQLLVTRSTEEGKADYRINVKTKKYEPALKGTDGAELLPSPDGKTAVFLNEAGEVF